jgi:very-short-patch-repair endonuclease
MPLLTRRELRAVGITDRRIAEAVASGELTRLRGGIYADSATDHDLMAAVRCGGRLACASELRRRGVWILDERVHVHFTDRPRRGAPVVRHWRGLIEPPTVGSVSAVDELVEAMACLERPAALAAVDSALHLGVVARSRLDGLELPAKARLVLDLADGRAESGLESLARLIAHDLGMRARPQVVFEGIGRVDLLVHGAVVIEADGDQYHSDLAARRRDRRRDAQLAALGFPVLRFGYDQLVGSPGEVARALIRTVSGHRGVKNPGSVVQIAMKRAHKLGWA